MKFLPVGSIMALLLSPAIARDFRPETHLENIPLANSSIQQCYIISTTAGVRYTVESSEDLSTWTSQDEIYGVGNEYAVTMREYTAATATAGHSSRDPSGTIDQCQHPAPTCFRCGRRHRGFLGLARPWRPRRCQDRR